jgi:hypothetical protein
MTGRSGSARNNRTRAPLADAAPIPALPWTGRGAAVAHLVWDEGPGFKSPLTNSQFLAQDPSRTRAHLQAARSAMQSSRPMQDWVPEFSHELASIR